MGTSLLQASHECFNRLRKATRFLIHYARNFRLLKYGKAILRVFVKKPSMAFKSILRTSEGTTYNPTLHADLSILRDVKSGRLLTTPSEVLTQLTQIETTVLSPYPTLPLGAPFL